MKQAVAPGIIVFLSVAVVSMPLQAAEREEPTFSDVGYGPHELNVLDYWQAPSDTPTPVLVWIHGGGFISESKDMFGREGGDNYDIQKCWDAGVSVSAIDYRLLFHAPLQDIVRDCGRAIQFLRHKAQEWNIDKTRIASFGGSAGGGTSLWLAFHDDLADPDSLDPVLRESTRLCAVGALVTPASWNIERWWEIFEYPQFTWVVAQSYVNRLVYHLPIEKSNVDEIHRVQADLDILALIDAQDPPVFLRTSGVDSALNFDIPHHPRHTQALKRACDAAKVPCTAVYRDTPPEERVYVLDFLLEHLRTPDRKQ